MKGKFYGVGVGSGDPELLTIKALRVMKECEVIAIALSKEYIEKPIIMKQIVETPSQPNVLCDLFNNI